MNIDNFVTLSDFEKDGLDEIIEDAVNMKKGRFNPHIKDKNLILLFFNPSLRTRTSFELAMKSLYGNVVTLNASGDVWKLEVKEDVVMDGDKAEHIRDAARVLGRYADAIGVRAFALGKDWNEDKKDPIISAFLKYSGVPVINMESSLYHPNQALADIMTIKERFGKDIKGVPITITWANHPNPLPMAVANSILIASALFGMDIRFTRPEGYDLDSDIMEKARELVKKSGGNIKVTDNIEEGFKDSSVVYAKSWGSLRFYGKKEEEKDYKKQFKNWIVNDEIMELTNSAFFMHCLPVRRNVVVSDSVIDGKNSVVYDEAENRLHVQKSILYHILKSRC